MNNFPEYINTALVVGLGSIGKRHIKILKEIYPDIKIIVLRHRRGVEKLKDVEKNTVTRKICLHQMVR